MASYRQFEHVVRLDPTKLDVGDFLDGTIYVFSKSDGTNFSAWADELGNIHCGSRHREISLQSDNAKSMAMFTSLKEYANLRNWLSANPQYIIYGEWLGGKVGQKFTGTIKSYEKPGLMLFAVYNFQESRYLTYPEYSVLLDGTYDQVVEPLAVLDHPTLADVNQYVENHYNLPADVLAEGIVLWRYDYCGKLPDSCLTITKIVNAEAKQGKGKQIKKNSDLDIERRIVESFVTDADCAKAKQKAIVYFDLEEWEINKATMGYYLNALFEDLIEEEMMSILRVYKMPTIDFTVLIRLVKNRGREYLGLS